MAPMEIDLRGIVTLIEVFNIAKSIAFYRDALGFEVLQTAGPSDAPGWALLRCGEVELMLNSMYDPGEEPDAPDPARIAAHRDTTLFIGCPDLDAAYTHLRAAGISVQPPIVASYGMKQLSFSDPDGYGICLQWPDRA
jgi:glyoxylase I family protein